ncbi:MAG: GGDEF domain-containing protein [Minisyncoccota bacterium]
MSSPLHAETTEEVDINFLRSRVQELERKNQEFQNLYQNLLVERSVERQELQDENAKLKEALARETTIDHLTQVLNRKGIDAELYRSFSSFKRSGDPFSVLYIDLDNFKPINERLGHLVGDLALKKVANLIRSQIRPTDRFGRWGGDEFVIILNHTGAKAANATVAKLQKTLASYKIHLKGADYDEFYVADASMGTATSKARTEHENELMERADELMRRNKVYRKKVQKA